MAIDEKSRTIRPSVVSSGVKAKVAVHLDTPTVERGVRFDFIATHVDWCPPRITRGCGGTGRRAGFRIQFLYGVQVRFLSSPLFKRLLSLLTANNALD